MSTQRLSAQQQLSIWCFFLYTHNCTLGENYSKQTILCVAAAQGLAHHMQNQQSSCIMSVLCRKKDGTRVSAHISFSLHLHSVFSGSVVTDSFKTSGSLPSGHDAAYCQCDPEPRDRKNRNENAWS